MESFVGVQGTTCAAAIGVLPGTSQSNITWANVVRARCTWHVEVPRLNIPRYIARFNLIVPSFHGVRVTNDYT